MGQWTERIIRTFLFVETLEQADFTRAILISQYYPGNIFGCAYTTSFVGVPAVAVPTGVVDGLPRGVQVIAAMHREDVCLAAAAAIEDRFGPITPIEPCADCGSHA